MRREQKSQIEEVFETCARAQECESGITSKFVDGRMDFLRASKQSEASMPPRLAASILVTWATSPANMACMALNVFDAGPFSRYRMRVVWRHLFLLPICGGSTQVQFGCEQTSRRSQTRIVCLSRERGELESGATAALRQGAVVGTGLVRRLGQMDEQERGECGLFSQHWPTRRASLTRGAQIFAEPPCPVWLGV